MLILLRTLEACSPVAFRLKNPAVELKSSKYRGPNAQHLSIAVLSSAHLHISYRRARSTRVGSEPFPAGAVETAYARQLTTLSPGMARRSLSLETTVQLPNVIAMAAIIISTTPTGRPRRASSA